MFDAASVFVLFVSWWSYCQTNENGVFVFFDSGIELISYNSFECLWPSATDCNSH